MWQFFLQIPAKTPESIQCALDQISKAPYRPPQFNQREVAWRIDFPLWSNRNTRAQNPIPVNKQIQMSACIILEINHQTIQFSGREFQFSLVREKDLRFAPRGSFSCKYKYRDAHLSSVIDARTTLSADEKSSVDIFIFDASGRGKTTAAHHQLNPALAGGCPHCIKMISVCRRAQIIKRILHAPVAHLPVRCASRPTVFAKLNKILYSFSATVCSLYIYLYTSSPLSFECAQSPAHKKCYAAFWLKISAGRDARISLQKRDRGIMSSI